MQPQVLLYGKASYPRELQSLPLNGIKSHFHLLEEETKSLSI